MRITVFYQSGKVSEFNTETFTTPEPFKGEGGGGANVATEFNLRLDKLETEGLMLEVFWYNALIDKYAMESVDGDTGRSIFHAGREPGRFVRLVSERELNDIAKICVDGEMVVWRQGDDVINAIKYFNQEILCYSDEVTRSVNAKVMTLYDYLKRVHPLATDEEVAQMLGYPYRAFLRVREAELAQVNGEEAFDGTPEETDGEDGVKLDGEDDGREDEADGLALLSRAFGKFEQNDDI